MERRLSHLFKLMMPLSSEHFELLTAAAEHLNKTEYNELRYALKVGWVDIDAEFLGSKKLGAQDEYPIVRIRDEDPDPDFKEMVDSWNEKIYNKTKEQLFNNFSIKAEKAITKLIAPNIIGLDIVKEATLLQLFAKEKVHVLLLGDPGTGKTDVIRSIADLAPKSSYGLGSGTSGAGLTVSVKGDEVMKGLLPMAHKGICCIDELNLLKPRDRAGLLNAMEKGFVTYDKASKHLQVDADVKVLATANPKGDRFAGWVAATLKKQLPFDPALISRFNLVFLIRRPDIEGFLEITKKIVSGEKDEVKDPDKEFVKEYIKHVNKLKVEFDKKLEPMITDFVEQLKLDEEKFLIEISPRIVVGIVRLSKASARMNMRTTVTQDDVAKVLTLIRESLYLKRHKR